MERGGAARLVGGWATVRAWKDAGISSRMQPGCTPDAQQMRLDAVANHKGSVSEGNVGSHKPPSSLICTETDSTLHLPCAGNLRSDVMAGRLNIVHQPHQSAL